MPICRHPHRSPFARPFSSSGLRLVLAALAVSGTVAFAGLASACTATAPLSIPPKFPAVATALVDDRALTIVAFGSSSTEGIGASGPATTYPARLEQELLQRLPGHEVRVVNSGIGGDTAALMMARLDRDVLAHRPDLVVWQLGTNDALRGVKPEEFRKLALQGVEQIRGIGADILFMEPQLLSGQGPESLYSRYIAEVRALGAELGIPVLLRASIMAEWAERGVIPAGQMLSHDGLHMTDASYRCLAEVVADAIAPDAPPA